MQTTGNGQTYGELPKTRRQVKPQMNGYVVAGETLVAQFRIASVNLSTEYICPAESIRQRSRSVDFENLSDDVGFADSIGFWCAGCLNRLYGWSNALLHGVSRSASTQRCSKKWKEERDAFHLAQA